MAGTAPAPKRWLAQLAAGERVWAQGFVVAGVDGDGSQSCAIDDGSAVARVRLHLVGAAAARAASTKGSYLLVVGEVTEDASAILAHNVIDLTNDPSRVPLWWLELAHIRQAT